MIFVRQNCQAKTGPLNRQKYCTELSIECDYIAYVLSAKIGYSFIRIIIIFPLAEESVDSNKIRSVFALYATCFEYNKCFFWGECDTAGFSCNESSKQI